jgi:hypothetical protein
MFDQRDLLAGIIGTYLNIGEILSNLKILGLPFQFSVGSFVLPHLIMKIKNLLIHLINLLFLILAHFFRIFVIFLILYSQLLILLLHLDMPSNFVLVFLKDFLNCLRIVVLGKVRLVQHVGLVVLDGLHQLLEHVFHNVENLKKSVCLGDPLFLALQ